MKNFLVLAAAVAPAFAAAAQQTTANPDVIWRGDFEAGAASLKGNCSAGQDGWCNEQTIRPEQIQIVDDPVAQGRHAARFEVKYGDVYSTYSDSRSVMSGPINLWEDEGSERWYRWQALWPQDWVGSYPKWDELSTPSARSWAGSLVEWHHDANGGVESGSAPLYIGADDQNIWLCLVDQATSACKERLNIAPLQRGHWTDFVMHAKWSSDASVGFIEIWIDGQLVLPKHFAANKYPGMRNYLIVGLYRNGHIGDPNLLYPNGTHVYGTDGTPGVAYLDGFIVGKTQAAVLSEMPFGPQAAPPPPPPADAGTPAPAPQDPAATAPAPEPQTNAAAGFPKGGCSSTGASSLLWLAAPLLLISALRRRRHAPARK